MGVNCVISLPTARLRDVANAIGILAGLPAKEKPIKGSKGLFVEVDGVDTKSCGRFLEACAYINLKASPGSSFADGNKMACVMYHFEFDTPTAAENINSYSRGMIPRSTPFWCAIGRRLVQTFGGTFRSTDFDDDPEISLAPHFLNGASNGPEWDANQRRILELKPITKADMDAETKAAYR